MWTAEDLGDVIGASVCTYHLARCFTVQMRTCLVKALDSPDVFACEHPVPVMGTWSGV